MHLLGVKDPEFMSLANNFIDQSTISFGRFDEQFILLYNWWNLGEK